MAGKKFPELFKLISRIVTWIIFSGMFLVFLIMILGDIARGNALKEIIIEALVILVVYLPVYGYLFNRMGKLMLRIGPYIKGGLFVIRMIVLLIFISIFIDQLDHIEPDLAAILNLSASKTQMAELEEYLENDDLEGLKRKVSELEDNKRKVDYIPIIARNFQLALEGAEEMYYPGMDPSYLTARLNEHFDLFQTMNIIRSSIGNYPESEVAEYIPEEDMLDLLLLGAGLHMRVELRAEAEAFYELAARLSDDQAQIILSHADALYEKHYWQEASEMYERYMSLMRNDGKDSKIPGRVREFVRSENYGPKLHQKLYGCYLSDYPTSPMEDMQYYEDDEYLVINNELYPSLWGNPEWVLYGNTMYYHEDHEHLSHGLAGCVAELLGEQASRGRLTDLMELTGINPLGTENDDFLHVNPEIIEWARKNLIPDTDLRLINYTCQTLYDVLLKDAVRKKALAYTFLTTLFNVEQVATEYENEVIIEGYNGFFFLDGRFGELASYNATEDIEGWALTTDAGFWVRRYLDGSYEECWNLINEVLSVYDYDFMDYGLYREWWDPRYEYEEEHYEGEMEGVY